MDKYILVQYCDTKEEIKKIEKRMEKIKKQTSMVADTVQNGYKRRAVIYGYDIKRKEKIEKLEEILETRHAKLLDIQIQAEEYINNIEESEIRQILTHRYIDGMNWIQIQIAMRI